RLFLHSFPSRRSSDLEPLVIDRERFLFVCHELVGGLTVSLQESFHHVTVFFQKRPACRDHIHWKGRRFQINHVGKRAQSKARGRSEEHTSELQSPDHL